MAEPDLSAAGVTACLAEGLTAAGIDLDAWPEGLSPDMSLDAHLGLDSLHLMQVARHLESAYAYRFSLADWMLAESDKFEDGYTIGSLIRFVQESVGAVP